jgi:hypothetical protein
VLPGQGCVRTQVVHSNALVHAFALLDVRSAVVAMQCHVHSSVGVAFDRSVFNRTKCVRTQIIAHGARLKRWTIGLDRATRTSRADGEYVRTWLLRSTVVRSNAGRAFERTCRG